MDINTLSCGFFPFFFPPPLFYYSLFLLYRDVLGVCSDCGSPCPTLPVLPLFAHVAFRHPEHRRQKNNLFFFLFFYNLSYLESRFYNIRKIGNADIRQTVWTFYFKPSWIRLILNLRYRNYFTKLLQPDQRDTCWYWQRMAPFFFRCFYLTDFFFVLLKCYVWYVTNFCTEKVSYFSDFWWTLFLIEHLTEKYICDRLILYLVQLLLVYLSHFQYIALMLDTFRTHCGHVSAVTIFGIHLFIFFSL